MPHEPHEKDERQPEVTCGPVLEGLVAVEFTRPGDQGALVLRGRQTDADADKVRRDLIERSRRGEQIELALTAKTYEQVDGQVNRRFIEFSPKALRELATTAPETSFVRDHRLWDTEASGGFCIASKLDVDTGTTRRALIETVRLTVPWAVQAALDGRMKKFSIGWDPVNRRESVLCTACKQSVYKCRHWPGELVGEGRVVVWRYLRAVMRERSWVLYPAVVTTGPQQIEQLAFFAPRRNQSMSFQRIAEILKLDPAASEQSILDAIGRLNTDVTELRTALSAAQEAQQKAETELATLSAEAKTRRKQELASEHKRVVAELAAEGRLQPGGARETLLGEYYERGDADAARALVDSYREGEPITLAGAPRQSQPGAEPTPATTTAGPNPAGTAFPRQANGRIDFHALAVKLPNHVQYSMGPYKKDPEPFIRQNWARLCGHLGYSPDTEVA